MVSPEFAAGSVVRVLQILVPHSELRSFTDRNPRGVTWLRPPPEGSDAIVSIFLTLPGIQLAPPSGLRNAVVVGDVRTSIRTAWAVYAQVPIYGTLAKLIEDERAKITRDPRAVSLPPGTRAALWESREDHDRHVLELACH
jgi:hypothetical protein